MGKYADSVWDPELTGIMSAALNPLEKVPEYDADESKCPMKAFEPAVTQGKIADVAAQLKKKVDGCKHCSFLAGMDASFTAEAEAVAKRGLSVITTLAESLILRNPLWESLRGSKDKFLEKELYQSLLANQKFVKSHGLQIREGLGQAMNAKLKELQGSDGERRGIRERIPFMRARAPVRFSLSQVMTQSSNFTSHMTHWNQPGWS